MQRRTFLLFGLFLATAWFYSSVANSSGTEVSEGGKQHVQEISEADQPPSGQESQTEPQDSS